MDDDEPVTTGEDYCSACGGPLNPEAMSVVCNGRTEHATCHRLHARQGFPTPREYDPVVLAVAYEICEEAGVAWGFAGRPDMVAAAKSGLAMLEQARDDHGRCLARLHGHDEEEDEHGDNGHFLSHGMEAHLPRDRTLWA